MRQGTDEWLAARCGMVTASRMADVMARTKSGYGAGRANYMAELVAETLTGQPASSFSNAAMQWGVDHEASARDEYAFMQGVSVEEVGFIPHPAIAGLGASPDGLVGDDGMVEIKCPQTATHIDTLLTGAIPQKYILQMHVQMMCADRAWCDHVSYDPRMPIEMQLWIKRVPRDDALVEQITREVVLFRGELDAKVSALMAQYAGDF